MEIRHEKVTTAGLSFQVMCNALAEVCYSENEGLQEKLCFSVGLRK